MPEHKELELEPEEREILDNILRERTDAEVFKITIEFGYKPSKKYKKAVDISKKLPTYKEKGTGDRIRHSVTFTPKEAESLFQVFNIVVDWEKTDIYVNHKKLPYAHSLWVPLMWFYRV